MEKENGKVKDSSHFPIGSFIRTENKESEKNEGKYFFFSKGTVPVNFEVKMEIELQGWSRLNDLRN